MYCLGKKVAIIIAIVDILSRALEVACLNPRCLANLIGQAIHLWIKFWIWWLGNMGV
jgi:hypothetical protein